ncbi:MAG TPA: hypothetical protein VG758_09560 [Hyphomicrobiaceae bacterium]|jgi:hypothetical protein|nr:hypothetical protein [Hyphomicrobiaceae bacterium]
MRRLVLAAAAYGFCLLAIQPAAAEDMTIVSEVVVPKRYTVGPRNATLTLWMTPGKARLSDGYRDWIYDVATGTRIDIDHQTRQYWQGTEADRVAWVDARHKESTAKFEKDQAEYERRKAEYDEGMARLEKEEAEFYRRRGEEPRKLPQWLRDAKERPDPPSLIDMSVSLEKGRGSKTILGYDCEHYRVWTTRTYSDGSKETELSQELWVAPKLEVPVPPEVLNLAPFLPRSHAGLALASTYPGSSSSHSVVAVEIKRGPIDASVFALPAGYTRQDSPISMVGSYMWFEVK